jgi:POT family proton-dependent oligopeptide transporter
MTAGHFCMAFESSFLPALGLIALGAGFLRGNLTPQVAELYTLDESRRAAAFQIYASMVAIGAFISPLATGWLAKAFDWHVAFAFAGAGMLVGVIWYWLGQPYLPPEVPRSQASAFRPLDAKERKAIASLIAIIPLCTLFWVAQAQVWNTYNLWVRDHVDLVVAGWTMPVPWLQALDGLSPLIALPILLLWWKRRERSGARSDEIARMATGCLIFAIAVVLLAGGSWTSNAAGKVLLVTPVLFHLISNIGWLYFQPSANSLFTGAAPTKVRGTMVGAYTVSMFAGSVISGRLGSLYEIWSPTNFWLLHAGLVGLAGLLLFAVAPWVRRSTALAEHRPDTYSAFEIARPEHAQ